MMWENIYRSMAAGYYLPDPTRWCGWRWSWRLTCSPRHQQQWIRTIANCILVALVFFFGISSLVLLVWSRVGLCLFAIRCSSSAHQTHKLWASIFCFKDTYMIHTPPTAELRIRRIALEIKTCTAFLHTKVKNRHTVPTCIYREVRGRSRPCSRSPPKRVVAW
jgi:hypothetical protein